MQFRLLFLIMFMLSFAHGTQAQPRRTADVCAPEWLATASAARVSDLVREGANANRPLLDYADARFARAVRQLPLGSPPYELEARIYPIMYRYAAAAEEYAPSTVPSRARSQVEPAQDPDDDEGPERFFYIGAKVGTTLSSVLLNTVEGDYHPGVTQADIDLFNRFGGDSRLLRYPERYVQLGQRTSWGLDALWLNARNSTGFGVSFNLEPLWFEHGSDDLSTDYVSIGGVRGGYATATMGSR